MPSTPRNRRRFNRAFKMGAVQMVTDQHYSINEAARRLEIDRKSLTEWIAKFAPTFDAGRAQQDVPEDPKQLAAELRAARKELAAVRLENEILKKATACFAKDHL